MYKKRDRVNFGISVSVLLGMSVPLLLLPKQSADVLDAAYNWIAGTFGWFYILTGAAAVLTVLFIGCSQYGRVRLGDAETEFSTASWVSMLFAAGIGSGMLYWSAIEWAHYVEAPPFSAEPFSEVEDEHYLLLSRVK